MRAGAVLRLCARPEPLYRQGQRPEPGIREYFYYVDHNGRLFLDDAKVKNFATCFKAVAFLSFSSQRLQRNAGGRYASRFPFVSRCGRQRNFLRRWDAPVVFTAGECPMKPKRDGFNHNVAFLSFFFKRLQRNAGGRYASRFPFVSRCGRERNFLRCWDAPVVFTAALPDPRGGADDFLLSYCGGGAELTAPFRPSSLTALPENGRLYHAAPERVGGVGLVSAALAQRWSSALRFDDGPEAPPTHFTWRGKSYRLGGELLRVLRENRGAFPGEE